VKKLIFILLISILLIGCSKNDLEPNYNKDKQKVLIQDISFSQMKEFNNSHEDLDIYNEFKDKGFVEENRLKGLVISSNKKHYVSLSDKDNFIIYKNQKINSNSWNMQANNNQLNYYDECKESIVNGYKLLNCYGIYLNEKLSINSITKRTKSKVESLELSKNNFDIVRNNLFKNIKYKEKINKRKRSSNLTIYKGLGEATTLHKECPSKLFLTVFKDFSSNINPYALIFKNGNIDTFHITEFNIFNRKPEYLEGKYRRYISKDLQCRGTFKVKLFNNYK